MAQNIGTLISAAIRPNDSLDPIASAYASEIKGGLHTVNSSTDRDNIIQERREWGMICYVVSEKKSYQLSYNYANINIMSNSNWVEFGNSAGSSGVSSTWIDSVIRIELTQPTSPSIGDRYLVGVNTNNFISGTYWSTLSGGGFVAEWNGTFWDITNPEDGFSVRVNDQDNSIYKYEGIYNTGSWVKEKMNQVRSISAISTDGINYTSISEPSFDTYSNDTIFLTKFDTVNIGMTASLNINSKGNSYIKKSTSNGVVSLNTFDIKPDVVYSLVYDTTNSYFLLTKPSNDDLFNVKYHIDPSEYIVVPENYQYWVYGDLTIEGVFDNYGQVIISNGNLVLNGGSYSNYGSGSLSFVDFISTSVDNGLELIGGNIGLGGTLSRDTNINGDGYDLIIGDIDTLMFTSSVFDVESDFISLDSGTGSVQIMSGDTIIAFSDNEIDLISNNSVNILGPTFSVNSIIIDPTTPNINDVLKFDGVKFKSSPDSVSSINNGLEIISGYIGLGGTLSRDTNINGDGYNLIIGDIDTLMFTSSVFDVESDFISLDSGTGSFQTLSGGNTTIFSNGDLDLISNNSVNILGPTFSVNSVIIDPTSPTMNSVLMFDGVKFKPTMSNNTYGTTYFVTPDGDDSTARVGDIGRPFGTISAARDAAVFDGFDTTLIYVYPGVYFAEEIQYENGNFFFAAGTIIKLPRKFNGSNVLSAKVITTNPTLKTIEVSGNWSSIIIPGYKFKINAGPNERLFTTVSSIDSGSNTIITTEETPDISTLGSLISKTNIFTTGTLASISKIILKDGVTYLNDEIHINRNWTSKFITGYKFKIDSGDNMGVYTVLSSTYDISTSKTKILIVENFTSISLDGFVYDEFSDIPLGSTMYTTKHHSKKCSVYGFGKFIIEETLDNDWPGGYIEGHGGTNFYGELDSIIQVQGVCIGAYSDSIVTIKGNFLEVTFSGYVSTVRDSSDTTFQFQRIGVKGGHAFFVRQGTDISNFNGSCIISADVIESKGNISPIVLQNMNGGYVSLICPKVIVDNAYFLNVVNQTGGDVLIESNIFTSDNGAGISISGGYGGNLSFKGNMYLKSNVAIYMIGNTNYELSIDGDIIIKEGVLNSIVHSSGKLRLNGNIKNIATVSNPITNGILISDSINRSLLIDNLKIIANDNSITSGDPLLVIPNKFKVIHSLSSNVPLMKTENIIASTPVTIDINIE